MLLCWLLSGKQTPFLIKNVSFDMPVQRGEAIELCDNKKGTNLDCRCVENRIYNKTHGLQKCKKSLVSISQAWQTIWLLIKLHVLSCGSVQPKKN